MRIHVNTLTRLQATQSLGKLYKWLAAFWSAAGETPYHGVRKDSAECGFTPLVFPVGVAGIFFEDQASDHYICKRFLKVRWEAVATRQSLTSEESDCGYSMVALTCPELRTNTSKPSYSESRRVA